MWNNDKYLFWSFVAQAYYRDQEVAIQHLPKITLDHIKLSSFGKMKVNYAIQVFSKSMANALRYFNPNGEADELAKFIDMVNYFTALSFLSLVKSLLFTVGILKNETFGVLLLLLQPYKLQFSPAWHSLL